MTQVYKAYVYQDKRCFIGEIDGVNINTNIAEIKNTPIEFYASSKQELLAEYIERKTKFNVTTFCLGAAIAFMTRKQAPINSFIDKFYLGWFARLLFRPKEHFKRTVESFTLIKLFINNS